MENIRGTLTIIAGPPKAGIFLGFTEIVTASGDIILVKDSDVVDMISLNLSSSSKKMKYLLNSGGRVWISKETPDGRVWISADIASILGSELI
jgi:hypothetical protein